ncbi:MAG TPA: chromosome segregation protein SMC [Candidatus Eisenbacteria bacterium]|nr:chromosome segregation protein SMC [Candidatus Eisenbacteria bacterium]
MFLKRLDIQGFKSFPQRVRVDFGPGITSIVGPNGSGKTNIVEAIRWVLGEQNMRHLRGDTLEDVIFTGSAHRKPLGMAEVALTMFNNRGVLPSEYSELTISRRTFRNGQSEYSINKNICRLRDVRDLFLDTGMGSHAYSLIERGMVDNVLSDESGHRRFLFEEAAGIMRYKTRKKEALQKLDLTLTDLTRVNDVVGEIEREVRSLARQVGKARRYGRLRDEIRAIDLGLAKEDHDRFASGTSSLRTERQRMENRRAELSGHLARHEAELEELKLELLKREGEVRLAQEALGEHEAKGAALLNEVAVLRERRTNLSEKLEHARSEATRLKASVDEVRLAAARLEEERARLERVQVETGGQEQSLAERLLSMGPALEERRGALTQRKQLSLDLFQARVHQESSARALRGKHEDLSKRREELRAQLDALSREAETLRGTLDEIAVELGDTAEAVALAKRRVEEATASIAGSEVRIEAHDEVEKRAREAHAGLEARHATLKELKESYEGYDQSVRWLVAGPSRPARILGTVGDVLHASGEWLAALEAALGEAVQFIVAERSDAALQALKALEQSGEGRATFVALDRLSRARVAPLSDELLAAPGVRGPLLDHVRFEPGYIALAAFFLSGIIVVDSIQHGLDLMARFPDQRLHFVTMRGERVVGPGIVYGGSGGTRAGSVLRREDELLELASEIERSAAALAETVAIAESLRIERASAQAEQEQAGRNLRDSEHAHRALEARRAEQTIRGDAMGQAKAAIGTALESLEDEIARTVEAAEKAEVALESADQERGRVDEILAQEESAFRAFEQEREQVTALHAEARIEATRSRTAYESAQREIERMRLAADEAERDIRSREEEGAETERRIQETAALSVQREEELSREVALKADKELALSKTRERFGEVKGKADDIEARTRDLRREHNELIERLHRIELEQAETDGELRRLAERIWNEYEIELAAYVPASALADDTAGALVELEEGDLADAEEGQVPDEAIVDRAALAGEAAANAVPLGADASPEERRDRLRTLQEKLRGLGPVNLLAVQDYEERRVRLQFLTGQRKDLDDARQQLLEAIEKINQTASDLFLKTFALVNENFRKVFTSLFEGGEAALLLTGDDPLEAEIEILARPRGKKPQSISLLSGGEKALTAIALLFAIYLVKPSPFCILDEVDAPLDDANVERFVRLLREFAQNTQFIVVTHNKKTMEVADALYGVTMQELGVSKIVSVKWNRDREDTEEAPAPTELEPVES